MAISPQMYKRRQRAEAGVSATEMALVLLVVAMLVLATLFLAGGKVAGVFCQVSSGLEGVSGTYGCVVQSSGINDYGGIGLGNTTNYTTYQSVAVGGIRQISGSWHNTILLMTNGTVKEAGPNWSGQLGDGGSAPSSKFKDVPGLTNIIQVAAGGDNFIACDSAGAVWTWGDNGYGQLGYGTWDGTTMSPATSPTPAHPGLPAGKYISCGATNTNAYAISSTGTVYAWGMDQYGQLGDNNSTGTTTRFPTPIAVAGINNGLKISTSGSSCYVLVLTSAGTVYDWGCSWNNMLGRAGNFNIPGLVVGLPGSITQISAGGIDNFAMTASGALYDWGDDTQGGLCNGSTTSPGATAEVNPRFATVRAAASGKGNSIIIDTSGNGWACGDNSSGQLGIGSVDTNTHTTPVKVYSNGNAVASGSGTYDNYILTTG